jgi:L-ascorbate metabolism protein UlaG (beta-lactamase superfamily)
MKIHFLGHASLLIETSAGAILMDPVFSPSHQEGLLDIFPKRALRDLDALSFKLLVISHRHLDHFDIATLAGLSRDCRVIIPDDDLIAHTLQELGYRQVERVRDFDEVAFGEVRLTITRSENRVPEFGMIVRDGPCVVWNAVDTIVSEATSSRIAEQVGQVDLLIAPWQPLLENNFPLNRSLAFPHERVGAMLEQIARIAPRHVVPGSCMFSYLPPAAFMNQLVFPLTLKRFTRALEQRCPELAASCYAAGPSDVVLVDARDGAVPSVSYRPAASPFAVLLTSGESEPRFAPVSFGVPFDHRSPSSLENRDDLHDDDLAEENQWHAAIAECSDALPRYIASMEPAPRAAHRDWDVVYQLTVVSPTRTQSWHYHLADALPHARDGTSEYANLESTITLTALHGLIDGTLGWDYALLSGSFRSFASIYRVTTQGLTYPAPRAVAEPLRNKYTYDAQLERIVERQLAQLNRVDSQ